jgi:hypothetical protein
MITFPIQYKNQRSQSSIPDICSGYERVAKIDHLMQIQLEADYTSIQYQIVKSNFYSPENRRIYGFRKPYATVDILIIEMNHCEQRRNFSISRL